MALLSSFRRILKTDFKEEYQPLIDQLAVSVNNGFDTLYDALNGKLSFKDNILSTIAEFNVSVDANEDPRQQTQIKLKDGQQNIEGVIVLSVQGVSDSSLLPTGGLAISFSKNNLVANINNIKGLEANKNYRIKVLILG